MKNAWNEWMVLAKKFGNMQANILLSLVYFLVIIPLGFLFRLTGKFRVEHSTGSGYWNSKKKNKQDMEWARKQ